MLTEADTCRKFVVPKLQAAGWDDSPHSIAEQRSITDGRIVAVGKGFVRKPPKRVDYLLCYLLFPVLEKSATPLRISPSAAGAALAISVTPLRKSARAPVLDAIAELARRFPLPWSHYTRLLRLRSVETIAFYHAEVPRGGWTVKQLERQIDTQFYERTALSRDKVKILSQP